MKEYKTIAAEWKDLDSQRVGLMETKRECAALTIPTVLPPEDYDGNSSLNSPYCSVPGNGCVSISARISGTMLPLNGDRFFSIDITGLDAQRELDLLNKQDPGLYVQAKQRMSEIEAQIHAPFYTSNYRAALFTLIEHLAIVGDATLRMDDDGTYSVHTLDQYVVRRTPNGDLRVLIIREWVDPNLLPDELSGVDPDANASGDRKVDANQALEAFYTKIEKKKGKWVVTKEFRNKKRKAGTYEVLPYIVCRWVEVPNKPYGRSLVEENLGTIRSCETLCKCLLDVQIAMSQYRMGVNPAGITKVEELAKSENGDFVPARPEDVFSIHAELQGQAQSIQQALESYYTILGKIFLMDSYVQPQKERVTAYQSAVFAEETQRAIGQPLTGLFNSIQPQVVRRQMEIMKKNKELDEKFVSMIDNKTLSIKIRTGLEQLAKDITNQKLVGMVQLMLNLPEPAQEVVDWAGLLRSIWYTSNMDHKGIILSEEEVNKRRQEKSQMETNAMAQQQMIASAGKIAEQTAVAPGVPS